MKAGASAKAKQDTSKKNKHQGKAEGNKERNRSNYG